MKGLQEFIRLLNRVSVKFEQNFQMNRMNKLKWMEMSKVLADILFNHLLRYSFYEAIQQTVSFSKSSCRWRLRKKPKQPNCRKLSKETAGGTHTKLRECQLDFSQLVHAKLVSIWISNHLNRTHLISPFFSRWRITILFHRKRRKNTTLRLCFSSDLSHHSAHSEGWFFPRLFSFNQSVCETFPHQTAAATALQDNTRWWMLAGVLDAVLCHLFQIIFDYLIYLIFKNINLKMLDTENWVLISGECDGGWWIFSSVHLESVHHFVKLCDRIIFSSLSLAF